MEQEVTLLEMLEAREARASRQREILDSLGCPVVSFTMNIPGPVKNGPTIRRAFREGLLRLDAALETAGLSTLSREEIDRPTGCEALWAVQGPGRQIKELCASIEDRDPLGRLFDLDVLEPERGGWSREDLGLSPRRCLVCGRVGKGCASRRLHTVEELRQRTGAILRDFFARTDREMLAGQAARALMYEVCTTPKPGWWTAPTAAAIGTWTCSPSWTAPPPCSPIGVRRSPSVRRLPPSPRRRLFFACGRPGWRRNGPCSRPPEASTPTRE